MERSEARLRAIGAPMDQKANTRLLSVKAPVSGSVISLQVAPGAYLNDATAAMMTIANLDTIWVTANVPEKDTSFVAKGQPVSVTFPAYPGKVFQGKVLFVSDVVDALITAAESDKIGEIYNVGSGRPVSVNELVKLLGSPATVHIPKRPGEPDCTWADISKIERELGWRPKVSFADGVKVMLENIDYWRDAPVWTASGIADRSGRC